MMMFHCGSPVGEMLMGWSFASSDERAGRVVADAQHRVGLDARLADHRAHDGADRPPDVLRRLLGVFGQRAVDLDGSVAIASRLPVRSNSPARALAVPTSTPIV
jgi:hypothetical protein